MSDRPSTPTDRRRDNSRQHPRKNLNTVPGSRRQLAVARNRSDDPSGSESSFPVNTHAPALDKMSSLEVQVRALEAVCRQQQAMLFAHQTGGSQPTVTVGVSPTVTVGAAPPNTNNRRRQKDSHDNASVEPAGDDKSSNINGSKRNKFTSAAAEFPDEQHLAVFHPYFDQQRQCCGIAGGVQNYPINKIRLSGSRCGRTLYLRSVPPALTLGALRAELDKVGTVLRVRLVPPLNWYSSKKQWMYGFVEFQAESSAQVLADRGYLDLAGLVDSSAAFVASDRSHSSIIRLQIAKAHIGNHFSDDAYFHPTGKCQTGLGNSANRTCGEFALSTVRAPLPLPEGMDAPDTHFIKEGEVPPPPPTMTPPCVPGTPHTSVSPMILMGSPEVRVGKQATSPYAAVAAAAPSSAATNVVPTPTPFGVELDCQVANSGRLNMGFGSALTPSTSNVVPPPPASPSATIASPQDVIAALRRMQNETAVALKEAEARAQRNSSSKQRGEVEMSSSSSSCSSSHTESSATLTSNGSSGAGGSGSSCSVVGKDGIPLSRKAARGKLRKDRQLGKKIAALATAIVSTSSSSSSSYSEEDASNETPPTTPQPSPKSNPAPMAHYPTELTEDQIEVELARKKQMARQLEIQLRALEAAKAARAAAVPVATTKIIVQSQESSKMVVQVQDSHNNNVPSGLSRRQKAVLKRERRQQDATPKGGASPVTATSGATDTEASSVGNSPFVEPAVMSIKVGGKAIGQPLQTQATPQQQRMSPARASATSEPEKPAASPIADEQTSNESTIELPPPSALSAAVGAAPFVPSTATKTSSLSKHAVPFPPPYPIFPSLPAASAGPVGAPKKRVGPSTLSPNAPPWQEQLQDENFVKWLARKPMQDQLRFYASLTQAQTSTLASTAEQCVTKPSVGVSLNPSSNLSASAAQIQPSQRRMIEPVRALLERQRLLTEAAVDKRTQHSAQQHAPAQTVRVGGRLLQTHTDPSVDTGSSSTSPTGSPSLPPSSVAAAVVTPDFTKEEADSYDRIMASILGPFDEGLVDLSNVVETVEQGSVEAALATLQTWMSQSADDAAHVAEERGDSDSLNCEEREDIGVIGAMQPMHSSCSSSSCASAPHYGVDGETDDVQSGSSIAQDTKQPKQPWGEADELAGDEVNIDVNFNELLNECLRPDPADESPCDPLSRLEGLAAAVSTSANASANLTLVHATLDAVLKGTPVDPARHVMELHQPLARYVALICSSTATPNLGGLAEASASLLKAVKDIASAMSLSLLEDDDESDADSSNSGSTGGSSGGGNKPLVCIEMIALEEVRALIHTGNICASLAAVRGLTEPSACAVELIGSGLEWLAESSSPKYLSTPSALIVNSTTELLDELTLLGDDEESDVFRMAGAVAGFVHIRFQQHLLQCAALAAHNVITYLPEESKALVGALRNQQLLLGNQYKRVRAVFSMTGARCGRRDVDVCIRASGALSQLTTLEKIVRAMGEESATHLFGVSNFTPPSSVAPLANVLGDLECAVSATKEAIKWVINPEKASGAPSPLHLPSLFR